VDKLGFIKTFEVVLAAVLLLSIYSALQASIFMQSEETKRSISDQLRDFLDYLSESGELKSVVESYNYLRLDSLFDRLFFRNINYYLEPRYNLLVNIDSDSPGPRNVSFVYDFPEGIDKNSIKVLKEGYELPVNAFFNWYKCRVKFNQDIKDESVNINFTIPITASNKTLKFYINSNEVAIDLNNWAIAGQFINASLTIQVPEVKANQNGYLYFSNEDSSIKSTYSTLTPTITPNLTVYNYEQSNMAEVLLQTSFDEGVNLLYLDYSLFSSIEASYKIISGVNNEGVRVKVSNDDIKDYSTKPILTLSKSGESVDWLIPIKGGFSILTVYGEYS